MRLLWFALFASSATFPLGPAGQTVLALRRSRGSYVYNDAEVFTHCFLRKKKPLRYAGGMLGVSANVLLFVEEQRAVVRLRGVPIGGTIAGVAWFKSDGLGVELDSDLERALRRRCVLIASAGARKDLTSMWVKIRLPFGLGRHTLTLVQVTD